MKNRTRVVESRDPKIKFVRRAIYPHHRTKFLLLWFRPKVPLDMQNCRLKVLLLEKYAQYNQNELIFMYSPC
jgi:hypothetical protein